MFGFFDLDYVDDVIDKTIRTGVQAIRMLIKEDSKSCKPAGNGIVTYDDLNKKSDSSKKSSSSKSSKTTYILNTNSMKYHYPDCPSVKKMAEHNKKSTTKSSSELEAEGYTMCGNCAKRQKNKYIYSRKD